MFYKVTCPFCRQKFEMEIFHEDGEFQDFTYDCEVCCRPIEIRAKWEGARRRFILMIDRGDGFDEMPYLG